MMINDKLRNLCIELMLSKATHNFSFSRDELFELLGGAAAVSLIINNADDGADVIDMSQARRLITLLRRDHEALKAIRLQAKALTSWWVMVSADAELAGEPIDAGAVILNFSGSGASAMVTADQIEKTIEAIYTPSTMTKDNP